MRYDLVVIGGGPAGEKAAVAAAYFGRKVALVERAAEGPGGAVVHTGTLPSKSLRETALYLDGFRRRELDQGFSVSLPDDRRSPRALMCRLSTVVAMQTKQVRRNLERRRVPVFQGNARIEDPNTVVAGEQRLETEFILITTGSRPRRPEGFDFSDPGIFTSKSILELERLPNRMAVVGGGVIGSEYACVFSTFGTKVDLIERRPRLLSFLDHDVSDALMASMQQSGIELHLDDGVERVARVGDELQVILASGKSLSHDAVMVSAGRFGNIEGLNLEGVGVEFNARGLIVVDDAFRTSVPNIYAGGDVVGKASLASASMEQGRIAVSAMFGEPTGGEQDWSTIPSGIYTIPEACTVGATEQELIRRGISYVVGRSYMRHNARGQIIGDTDGFVKLLFNTETRKLLGAHVIGERATELIHLGQAVMRLGGTLSYFIESVMSYPSLSVAYKYAAYDALGKLGDRASPPDFE